MAWKDGVKSVRIVKVVEGRVELGIKKGPCSIDIMTSFVGQAKEVAKEFLTDIREVILLVLLKTSKNEETHI